MLTKSVAKTWLLPGQEILYQLKGLNETWWALAVDGNALPDKVLLGSNQHSQSLCSPSPWQRPGYFLAKEILYQLKDLNETWWALAVDGNALPDKVLLGSNQHSQSLCSPSPWQRPGYFLAKKILYQLKDLNETWWALAVDGNALPDKVLLGSNQHSQSLCSPSPWQRPGYFLAKEILYQLKDLNETWWALAVDGNALPDKVLLGSNQHSQSLCSPSPWQRPGYFLAKEILYQLKDLNETWWALAVDGNALPDKVLLGSNQHSQSLCSPSPWQRPGYFLAKEILYQLKDLNETWWALAVDGNALPDKVLLGSNQHSQSLCSPSPWQRPGYFLAKKYFTSWRILMKLGEHLQ